MHAKIPLEACADRFACEACKRIAFAHGLPDDGHVIHTLILGQSTYYFMGPERQVKIAAVQGSDSDWGIAGHYMPVITVAESAIGKDTLQKILRTLTASHRRRYVANMKPACLYEFEAPEITTGGMRTELEQNDSQLQLWHPELEKILGAKGERYLREADMVQLAEGGAFGKKTEASKRGGDFVKPNMWIFIGSQPDTYRQHMGSSSQGRLRFILEQMQVTEVTQRLFFEKFVPRTASISHMEQRQFAILQKQQRVGTGVDPVQLKALFFEDASAVVHGAVHDGVNQTCGAMRGARAKRSRHIDSTNPEAAPMKHSGKLLGSTAVANAVQRIFLVASFFPDVVLDSKIRMLDELAAANKVRRFTASQVYEDRS